MIIDSHIHLYPEEASTDTKTWALQRSETKWLACVQPNNGPTLQGWASVDQLLRDMDAASVDQAIIQGWYWENPHTCHEQNEWVSAAIKSHPKRLHFMAAFNAHGKQASIENIKRCFDQGALGIGELNPPAQSYAYDNPILHEALDLVAQNNLAVNVHVTEPAGHTYPGKVETPFPLLQNMAKAHPETRFIFAHLGGLIPFYEFNKSARNDLANVFYDTAATPLLYNPKVYRSLCDAIGHSRILFGTDYPLRTFPKKQKNPDFSQHIQRIQKAELTKTEQDSILGNNALSVFRL